MKHRPPPVVGERANHRSLAAVTAAGRSRRRSPATGSRRGSEDAVAPARGWFVRETRLERHSSPRGPRTDGGPQAEMAPVWLYRIGSLCSRRPPPTAAATAAGSATAAGEAGKEQPAGPLDPPPLVLQKADSLDSTTP